jgi:hypothetical protein
MVSNFHTWAAHRWFGAKQPVDPAQPSFDRSLPIGGSRSMRNHHIRLDFRHEPTVSFVSSGCHRAKCLRRITYVDPPHSNIDAVCGEKAERVSSN